MTYELYTENELEELKRQSFWQWFHSDAMGRSGVVDSDGYTIIPPILTNQAAKKIVEEHNRQMLKVIVNLEMANDLIKKG